MKGDCERHMSNCLSIYEIMQLFYGVLQLSEK